MLFENAKRSEGSEGEKGEEEEEEEDERFRVACVRVCAWNLRKTGRDRIAINTEHFCVPRSIGGAGEGRKTTKGRRRRGRGGGPIEK